MKLRYVFPPFEALVSGNQAKTCPKALEEAITYHLQEGGFLDWARLTLRLAEPHRELAIAYAKLFEAVTTIREEQSHQFAKLLKDWTAVGSTRPSVLPVERILETVCAPIDEKIPILLIVIDGMSLAVGYELLSDLTNQSWQLLRPEPQTMPIATGLATLPSITEVSRTSLLCGQLQQGQANHEKQGFAQHPALLKRCKRNAPPLLFHKATLQSTDTPILSGDLHNAIESDKNTVVGVILNAVDDLLSKGDQVDTQWTFDQIKILLPLLQAAGNAKRMVILTSDHGHILHTNPQYQTAQGGERWRFDDSNPTQQELQLAGERVLVPDSNSLIAPWTENVRYCSAKKNGYHGGITPQEMIVPIAVIAPTNFCPTGWQETLIQTPPWWEPSVIASQEIFLEPSSQLTNQYADLGPLFSFSDTPHPVLKQAAWISNLLQSPVYQAQKQLTSSALSDEVVSQILTILASQSAPVTISTLAHSLSTTPASVCNLLPTLQRVLNADGYLVMTYDETGNSISLDLFLLSQQFEIDLSNNCQNKN